MTSSERKKKNLFQRNVFHLDSTMKSLATRNGRLVVSELLRHPQETFCTIKNETKKKVAKSSEAREKRTNLTTKVHGLLTTGVAD